jgi:hypothetical protein
VKADVNKKNKKKTSEDKGTMVKWAAYGKEGRGETPACRQAGRHGDTEKNFKSQLKRRMRK